MDGSRSQRKRRPSVLVESDEDRNYVAKEKLRDRERKHAGAANGYAASSTRSASPKRKPQLGKILAPLDLQSLPSSIWAGDKSGFLASWLRPKRRISNGINGMSPASATGPKLPLFGERGKSRSKLRLRTRGWSARQVFLSAFGLLFVLVVLLRSKASPLGNVLTFMKLRDPIVSLELSPAMVRRLWAWEVAAGHFPSHRMPLEIGLSSNDMGGLGNPGLPPAEAALHSLYLIPRTGAKRKYFEIPSNRQEIAKYPPRPAPSTSIDLDVIMEFCDFSANRYVRDCLEVMSAAAGLDRYNSIRHTRPATWRHLFVEDAAWRGRVNAPAPVPSDDVLLKLGYHGAGDERMGPLEEPPRHTELHHGADPACDPERPRIFHILWAGPFTDKPYGAAMAFLFTQNLGLHLPLAGEPDPQGERSSFLRQHCRPQMWIHINPGAAAGVQTPEQRDRMMDDLRSNPWSAPLLHDRFREVLSFHFYNISDHLDHIPELKDEWRHLPLFKSGQTTFGQKAYDAQDEQVVLHNEAKLQQARLEQERARQAQDGGDAAQAAQGKGQQPRVKANDESFDDGEVPAEAVDNALVTEAEGKAGETDGKPPRDPINLDRPKPDARRPEQPNKAAQATTGAKAKAENTLFDRVGSTSYADYDRLTTTLSDMARFVLCHRYGGVYLDADTLLLRDWEELWNWRGAFAYRWSRLPEYNTAILRMHRGSALGSFIFKIALANGLDFHPMSVWQYLSRAKLHGLLLRLPDALFDPAWLNTEYYQRDRPPFPYFPRFEEFFQPSNETAVAPNIVGVENFFRGSFAYHWHNQWWVPFDPTRDWPELGPRFAHTEALGRLAFEQKLAKLNQTTAPPEMPVPEGDLSWATTLKRSYEAYIRGERPNLYGEQMRWSGDES